MHLKEKHISVSIQILKAILEDKGGISDLKKFISDYKNLKETIPSYMIDELIEKAVKKKKINKKIESFYYENKKFIKMIVNKNYYYKITSTLFLGTQELDWFLSELEEVNVETLDSFVRSMEQLNLTDFVYTESDMKIQSYIFIQNSIFSEKTEFSTILTDGELFFLGRYYNESYPYFLRNAKYVIEIHSNNYGYNQLYINTFNIKLPDLESYNQAMNNIPTFNSQDLKNRTSYIRYLFELYKMQKNLSYNYNNVYNCKKLLDTENEDLYSILNLIDNQILEVNRKIEEVEEKFSEYGYDEETFKINIKYMENCQRNFNFDLD